MPSSALSLDRTLCGGMVLGPAFYVIQYDRLLWHCGRTDAEREVEVGRLSYRVSRLEAS